MHQLIENPSTIDTSTGDDIWHLNNNPYGSKEGYTICGIPSSNLPWWEPGTLDRSKLCSECEMRHGNGQTGK